MIQDFLVAGWERELAIAGVVSLFWFCLGLWRGRVSSLGERRQRRTAEAAERHFREAMDALSEGVAYLDREGRYLFWNRRYAEIAFKEVGEIRAGMSLESVLRAGLAEELYPEALGREEAWLRERLARHGVEHSLHEQPLSDGRWLRIEAVSYTHLTLPTKRIV